MQGWLFPGGTMFTEFIEYLSSNKIVLIGAMTTLGEMLVIIFNTYRRIKADKKEAEEIVTMGVQKLNKFLWVINPINIFRKA